MNGQWLKLSEGSYYFGNGGIVRIETIEHKDGFGNTKPSPFITTLFSATGKVTVVKNSLDEIETLLYNSKEETCKK